MSLVLVDTTAWVDFFADRPLPHVAELARLLAEGEDLCTCGVILTEVLQGVRLDRDYREVATRFEELLFLPMERPVFVQAAELYRGLRRRGITIRKPVDCMIAAVALQHDLPLLHNDRDFDPLEAHCGLRVQRP